MPERSSKRKKRGHDFAVNAFRVVQETTEEDEETQAESQEDVTAPRADGKNPAAVALGRLGGKKGGKARAAKLTPERRREIAKNAAAARWHR